MLYGITAATSALLLAAALAALLRTLALRLGLVDRRRARPVPLLGGLAVIGGTALVAGVGDWTGVAPLGDGVGRLLVAGIVVGALGLAADLRPVPLTVQLAVETGAAAATVPYDDLGVPAGLLAVAWIVFVVNAFAALDHADGAMGTVAVVTAFALGGCAAAEVMDGLAALLSGLAAALTGFLMHGRPPARILPGRCGALFAGFLLASAAVCVHAGREVLPSSAALFALTAVATADVVLVLVSRRLAGRPLFRSGPDHLVHRLRGLGLTPQGALVVLGATAFAGALVGMLIHLESVGPTAALWVAGAALAAVLGLLRVPAYGARRRTPGPRTAAPGATSALRAAAPRATPAPRTADLRPAPAPRAAAPSQAPAPRAAVPSRAPAPRPAPSATRLRPLLARKQQIRVESP